MHASKGSLTPEPMGDSYVGRLVDWGEYSGYFEEIRGGTDFTPLFKGLPDDMCQSPHWGYVFKGKIRFTFKDHEEVISAGEMYYAPAGHTFTCLEDAETVEFSPSAALQQTFEVAAKNLASQTA
jgi:hypothetical protein